MQKIIFNSSKPFTLGCELEVRLIDEKSLIPVGKSDIVFKQIPSFLKGFIHPELLESMAEIVTPVCKTPSEAVDFVKKAVESLNEIGLKEGFKLTAAGTHPFINPKKLDIVNDPRYLKAYEEFGVLLDRFRVCGLHIHVGFASKEEVIKAYNFMITYLPLFLALSASSPFFDGEFTKIKSFRSKIVEQIPRTDVPERFGTYESFEKMLSILLESQAIESVKDIRWDIRIHPDFGTLELRICDSVNEFERIKLLIALYQALAFFALKMPLVKSFVQIDKQNKWYSAKYALDGKFIEGSKITTIKEDAFRLFDRMKEAGVFKELNLEKYEKPLFYLLEKETIADRMIKEYEENKSLEKIVLMGVIE